MAAPLSAAGETTDARAAVARVTRRLVSFAFICYVVAYVDRVNIGFAAGALQKDLHLGDAAYGLGGGLFFLGYCLFEIPSNLLLERVGARLWIARIMIAWGLVSMATMFVSSAATFFAARVLLGIAEAGFFPGMLLYLTYWIPASDRARIGALFMMAAPVAVIVGSPVSELLLALNGRAGLAGWQWLFIGEGLPAVALGLLALFVLTDYPEEAEWLPHAERVALSRVMKAERAERQQRGHASLRAGFSSPRVWLLTTVYFLNTIVSYGIFLWLPKILSDASHATGLRLSAITSIPFVAALVGMVLIGRHSDRTRERKGHVAACALSAAVGLVMAASFSRSVPLLVFSFTLSQVGQRAIQSVFWAMPPMLLAGTAAAAGMAFINAIGNLGGAVGPTVMGALRQSTGSYSAGLLVLAAALIVEAALVMTIRLPESERLA